MNFFELKGKTIVEINEDGLTTSDGVCYAFIHHQDCCESCSHERTIGNYANVIGSPITLAEDDHPSDPEWYKVNVSGYSGSHTWTMFALETVKGRVEIWFLGESNGYYNETMSFVRVS